MAENRRTVTISLTKDERSKADLLAAAEGLHVCTWAKDRIVDSLGGVAQSASQSVLLAEVKALGGLVVELATEWMLYVCQGDQDAAFREVKEMVDRARRVGA